MTGEITLRGKVLPIGGLKEKILAAHRSGLKTIIVPRENEKDLADIPKNVLDSLAIHMVESMDEVLKIALVEPLATSIPAAGAGRDRSGTSRRSRTDELEAEPFEGLRSPIRHERRGRRGIPHDGIPHVVLVGRSNVGKSTLLNALTRAQVARTSAAPGKTRLANLYQVAVEGGPGGPGHWSFYFADLPGYGYARGGRESVVELTRIADAYFGGDHAIAGVLHLVDARHPELDADLDAAKWLQSLGRGARASWRRKSTSCHAASA